MCGLTLRSTPFASLSGRCAMKPRSAGHLHYKGFPKKRNYPDGFSFITFSCSGFVSRRGSMKKMADCETTTGHVGHVARTLMKDARRGLNRWTGMASSPRDNQALPARVQPASHQRMQCMGELVPAATGANGSFPLPEDGFRHRPLRRPPGAGGTPHRTAAPPRPAAHSSRQSPPPPSSSRGARPGFSPRG